MRVGVRIEFVGKVPADRSSLQIGCPSEQAYVDELSRDLHAELAPHGVTVENQAPFYVATKMSKIRKPRLDAPSPAAWVSHA